MERRQFLVTAGLAAAIRPMPHRRPAPQPDRRFEDIAALVTAKMAEHHVPAVGLGILKDGQLTLRGFGVTSIEDPQPVTPDTVFTIASISKTFAATAVTRLVAQGKMDLNAPVRTYLPEFRVLDDAASREVAIWHLLTHTPGWEGQLSTEDVGAEALARFAIPYMKNLPQLARPGEVWSYNNAGFTLAGRILEVVTGKSIHDALRELVFAPLGLTNTHTRLTDSMTRRFTLGHREQGAGRGGSDSAAATRVIRPYQTTSSTTAGGVMTSINDLMAYLQVHLGDGSLAGMRVARATKNATGDEMGIGWHLRPVGGLATCAHGGTLNGHCLLVELVPTRKLAFTVLTNHTDGWRLVQAVEAAILKSYEGVALAPNQAIGHRGVNEAMTFHAKELATQPDLAQYVGTYRRPPVGNVEVGIDAGRLNISGGGPAGTTIAFYGPDVAYATLGSYVGSPYEFIRGPDGRVGWIRVNGRIARRDT